MMQIRYTTRKWGYCSAKTNKSAAKGTSDLQWRLLLRHFEAPQFRCCSRSIVAVIKSAAVQVRFSGRFGFIAAGFPPPPYKVRNQVNQPLAVVYTCRYRCPHLAVGNKRRYRVSFRTFQVHFQQRFLLPLQVSKPQRLFLGLQLASSGGGECYQRETQARF